MQDIFDTKTPPTIGDLTEGLIAKMDAVRLPLGVHFGLSEEKYHADPALGSTSIRDLAVAPVKWQYGRMRPRQRVETEAMTFGKALHCRVLEGKQEFDRRYAKPPTPGDYPDALSTTDSIKDFLRQHGQKLTGNKPDLIARAKEIEECPPFFDDILNAWKDEHPNHQEITADQAQQVEDAISMMERDDILRSVMAAGSLINGASELSIIYEKDGVRRKARFDYALAPHGTRSTSLIIDLKAFSTFKGSTDEQAGISKIWEMAYDVQAAYYIEAFEAGLDLVERGLVFGGDDEYARSFFGAAPEWVWIMIRRDKGMVPIVMSLPADDVLIEDGRRTVEEALRNYNAYMAKWGPDQLWSPPPRMPLRLNKSMMPTWNRGLLHEQPE